jgi:hypothetical protein
MSERKYDPRLSHFDLDMARGRQAELWIDDIRKSLAESSAEIEVKRDAWFPKTARFYVERECCGRDGRWRPSGIATTKAKLWAFVFGAHPGALILEVRWLQRAVVEAQKRPGNTASMDYGQNPTRGIFVYQGDILKARDMLKDEH